MQEFKNIILMGKHKNYDLGGIVQKVANYLSALQYNVFLDSDTKENTTLEYPVANEGEKYDLVIAMGGDGTMMGAARKWGTLGIPLLGINQGRVGFLTDISSDDVFEGISEILSGKYKKEDRNILNVSVISNGKEAVTVYNDIAINDLVCRSATGKLMEFSLFLNDEFISSQYADGIIVATATGSTAYSLAAGGSIIHPDSEVLNIVPICPQSLSNRPLVTSIHKEIKILFTGQGGIKYTADGKDAPEVTTGHYFVIKNKEKKIKLIHPSSYSYFEGLRKKLKWC